MVITFDYIFECWKNKKYPDGFKLELEDYLVNKQKLFSDYDFKFINENHMTVWLSQILTVIEIGIELDQKRFSYFKTFWENLLGKKWKIDVENKWVIWD